MPPTEPGIVIRPPWPSEDPLFRRLLPGTLAGADRLVATGAHDEILAAAAWSYVDDRACGLRLEVRPAWRGRRLGRALAAAAIAACRQCGCTSLEAAVVHPGPRLLASLGFQLESTLTTASIDVTSQRAALDAAVGRFALPPGYTLRDCHAAALAPFCRQWHSHDRQVSTLAHIAHARHQAARALFRGAQPIGFIYFSHTPGTLTLDLWAAAPSARGTRANVALAASLIGSALSDGTTEIRFTWSAGTRHTPAFAARFSARTVIIQDLYLLPLLP